MQVTISADRQIDPEDRTKTEETKLVLEAIGHEAWIKLQLGEHVFEVSYKEFWDAARAVCIESYQ